MSIISGYASFFQYPFVYIFYVMSHCSFLHCKNYKKKCGPGIRYFNVPAVISNSCDRTRELSERRRREWLALLARKDSPKFAKVCSEHFVSGQPAYLMKDEDVDWVPTINTKPPDKDDRSKVKQKHERYNRRANRKIQKDQIIATIADPLAANDDPAPPVKKKKHENTQSLMSFEDAEEVVIKCEPPSPQNSEVDESEMDVPPPLEEPHSFNLKELCRLCTERHPDMVAIFQEEGVSLQLQTKINSLLPIKVERNDWLPVVLCRRCVALVNQTHDLYIASQQADVTLRAMFMTNHAATSQSQNEPQPSDPSFLFVAMPPAMIKQEAVDMDEYHHPEDDHNIDPEHNLFEPQVNLSEAVPDSSMEQTQSVFKAKITQSLLKVTNKKDKKNFDEADISVEKFNESNLKIDLGFELDIKKCEDCDQHFLKFYDYKSHMQRTHNIFVCRHHPEVKCRSKDELKIHKKSCKTFLCTSCGKCFKTERDLAGHSLVHGERNFQCESCGKSFFTKKDVQKHSEQHDKTSEKSNKRFAYCDICGRRLLRKHMSTHYKTVHNKDWKYCCNFCPVVCTNENEIIEHCAETHSKFGDNVFERKSDYYCNICKKYFPNLIYFKNDKSVHKRQQMQIATDPLNFDCEFCEASYKSKPHLKKHIATHHLTEKN